MSCPAPDPLSYLKPGTLWKASGPRAHGTVKVIEVRGKQVLVLEAGRRIWVNVARFLPKRALARRYVPIPDDQL